MTFTEFIEGMTDEQIDAYAKSCGTSFLYIRNHLKGGSRVPRGPLMNALWQNSGGKLTRQDVLDHFLPCEDAAAPVPIDRAFRAGIQAPTP